MVGSSRSKLRQSDTLETRASDRKYCSPVPYREPNSLCKKQQYILLLTAFHDVASAKRTESGSDSLDTCLDNMGTS